MNRWLMAVLLSAGLLVIGCGDDASGGDGGNNDLAPDIYNPGGLGGGYTPAQPVIPGGGPTAVLDAVDGDVSEVSDADAADASAGDGVTAEIDGELPDTEQGVPDTSDTVANDGVTDTDVAQEDAEVDAGPEIPYCDDKIPCTIETVLTDEGKCEGGKFICGDCAGSGCNFDSDCAPFNDDNPCNGVLKCNSGHCVVDKESVPVCDEVSSNPNERIRCNPSNGLCEPEPLPDGSACDDGDSCTKFDVMFGGFCGGTEICSSCEGLADGSLCDDGNPCTENTLCEGGRCLGVNVCECMFFQDCVGTNDENACNGYMTCIAGVCAVNPETVVHCQRACPKDSCYKGDCLEETGTCVGKLVPGCE